jgi:ABC-type multidrug transport system ATPase subunit
MNVIETSGLGKRYGGTWALRDCSLAIPAGHVAALVGPNGAGKSTFLNLAVGLAAPSAGAVTVLGGLVRSPSRGQLVVGSQGLPWVSLTRTLMRGCGKADRESSAVRASPMRCRRPRETAR